MKNSFKKIVSLVLTVLMLVGTFSAIIPITASAADSYTTITPNTNFTHNGVTYRFDVVDGHSDSVAKIYADGSIEVTMKNGDMLWFPEVSLKSDSEIHAEVTNLSTNCEGYFAAFAYGVMDQGSTWTEGMFATIKDSGRLRLCTATYSTLAGNNGADIKLFDHGGSTIKDTDTAWKDVVNINNAWKQDKTIAFDISKNGNNVTVDFAHRDLGSFGYAHTYDTTSNSKYYFEGGSVGFTSTYATAYKTFRIEEIEVDDFRVGVSEIEITPNTNFKHNGVTYRFDVVDGHSDSVAKIYADGSIEVTMKNGDMLWFPEVSLKSDSEIHAEVTNLSTNCQGFFAALAYGVLDSGSTWTEGMFATVKDAGRLRVCGAKYSTLAANNGRDFDIYEQADKAIKDTDTAWKDVVNSNNAWKYDKTIAFDIAKDGNNVTVDFAHPTLGSFGYAHTYDTTSNSKYYFEGGSVGFTATYATAYKTFRIEEIEVDDFRVGVTEETPDVPVNPEPELPEAPEGSVYLEKNKTATYNGITYRFDTNKENDPESWVRVNADGSWEINIRNGDMLWFPDVKLTDKSEVYMEVTKTGTNTSDYFPGLAYGVTSSTGSTWTSTNVSVLKTYNSGMRFRATAITRTNAMKVSGSDYGNGGDARPFDDTYPATALWELIANRTNNNWDIGKTVYHKVSQTSANVVLEYGVPSQKAAFVDPAKTSYANDFAGMYAIAGGSVGYTMVWQGNDTAHSQFRIEDITITNCTVGSTSHASYSVKAVAPKAENAMISLSLDGTIGLNFAFNATNLANAIVVAKKNDVEVLNQSVVKGENIVTVPVAAKEMTDTVNVAIMVDGEVFDKHSYTTSVSAYAAELMADDAYDEWDALITAMLNYGAAAQQLLNYKAESVDVSGIKDYDFSGFEAVSFTGNKSILKGLYTNLSLESNTVLKLYFMPADGVELSVTVNGEEAELVPNGDDGYYVVSIKGIAADELADDFAIVVNGELAFSVNALDWAKIASEYEETETIANALAAYADEAEKKNLTNPVSFDGAIATAADIAALRATTNARIDEIKNTGNMQVSGTVYYVSNEGSDSNSGTSSTSPFKTIAKVNSTIENKTNVTVCFRRGDTWRGEQLVAVDGLTVTAYGSGAKPVIMASPENGGGATNESKWIEVKDNIWRYEGSQNWSDVGNIIFNDGASFAKKITQLYVKNKGQDYYWISDFTNAPAQTYGFDSYEDLRNDLDFFHDKDFIGESDATGYLYIYSETNPALRFESIEFATDLKLVYIDHKNNVAVDNICFKYTGAHAIAAVGNSKNPIENLTVQNCEFYWIGGSIQDRIPASVIGTEAVVYDVRYGNAVEIYGACDGYYVRNNYIYQVFDAGITIQRTLDEDSGNYYQKNIEFTDNVIEYCNYSIEYFLTKISEGKDSKMQNFVISGNYMWNAGYGFCETRMIWSRGFAAHIKSQHSVPCNRADGFVISDNVMIGTRDSFLQIRNSFGESSMPMFENNTLYGYYDFDGKAAQGYRLGEVCVIETNEDQVWTSYDTNIDEYLAENMGSKYGEGNKFYFIF